MTQLIFYVNRGTLLISDFAHFSDNKNERLENYLEQESRGFKLDGIVNTGLPEVNNSGSLILIIDLSLFCFGVLTLTNL